MKRWQCPDCGRSFGRVRQSHECVPALSLREYLARQPVAQRGIYEAVLSTLKKLGDVDIDAVEVGIMIKRARTFCELRPKRHAVSLSFKLSRALDHPRIAKVIQTSAHRAACFFDLRAPADVDAELRAWIRAAISSRLREP